MKSPLSRRNGSPGRTLSTSPSTGLSASSRHAQDKLKINRSLLTCWPPAPLGLSPFLIFLLTEPTVRNNVYLVEILMGGEIPKRFRSKPSGGFSAFWRFFVPDRSFENNAVALRKEGRPGRRGGFGK